MSDPDDTPSQTLTLPTRVGHASWGDNRFRGHSVDAELSGRTSYWNVVSLAIGGPRLNEAAAGLLDDIASSSLAADPRIWPMKLSRLGSAYGRTMLGLFAGMVGTDQAQVGTHAVSGIARLLAKIAHAVDQGHPLDRQIEGVLAKHQRFPGFGVPARDQDERVVALRRCLEAREMDRGRHWALALEIEGYLTSTGRRLPMNFATALGSTLLDLGFAPEHATTVSSVLVLPNFLSNAYEGAQQRPAILQRLPDRVIDYVGPSARTSPRALEAREASDREPK